MVKGNWIKTTAAAILITAYILFVFWDSLHTNSLRKEYRELHLSNIKRLDKIYGIILGGSNSVYGISADMLTKKTDHNWYNASLKSEGETVEQFDKFVRGISNVSDKSSIKTVIYSSIKPFFRGEIEAYRQAAPEGSDFKLGLYPSRSALSYLKTLIVHGTLEPPYDRASVVGDFDFDLVSCDGYLNVEVTEVENLNTAADFLVSRAVFLATVFSSAKVIVLVPNDSEFDSFRYKYGGELIILANRILMETRPQLSGRVEFFFQRYAIPANAICDKAYHANSYGRSLRTTDLLNRLGY